MHGGILSITDGMNDAQNPSTDPNQRLPAWDLSHLFPEGDHATDAAALGPKVDAFFDARAKMLDGLGTRIRDAAKAGDAVALLRGLDESSLIQGDLDRAEVYCDLLHVQHPQDAGIAKLSAHVAQRSNELTRRGEIEHGPLMEVPQAQRKMLAQSLPALHDHLRALLPEESGAHRVHLPRAEIAKLKQEAIKLQISANATYDANHADGFVRGDDAVRLDACARAYNESIRYAFLNAKANGFGDPVEVAAYASRQQPDSMLRWWSIAPQSTAGIVERLDALNTQEDAKERLLKRRRETHPPHRYEWSEARALVTEALSDFNPAFRPILDRAFDEGWIQARPTGPYTKGGTTYMNVAAVLMPEGSSAAHPFVHSEYHYSEVDIIRLAHELGGHCLAAHMANERGTLDHNADIALHETFAIFAQKLVIDAMLAHAESPVHQATIQRVAAKDDLVNLCESTARCRFQHATFEAARQPDGSLRELSAQELTALYNQYGRDAEPASLKSDPNSATRWANSHHYFSQDAYYNDAYRVAIMAATALHERWEGAKGAQRPVIAQAWAEVMGAGNGLHFPTAMAHMGIDVNTPYFLAQGVSGVKRTIGEAEMARKELSSFQLFMELPWKGRWDYLRSEISHSLGITPKQEILKQQIQAPAASIASQPGPLRTPSLSVLRAAEMDKTDWQDRIAPVAAPEAPSSTQWQDRLRSHAAIGTESQAAPQWI